MNAPAASQIDFDADKLRAFIAENLGIDAKRVTDEAHFTDDLGLGRLDKLELMILIEYEFADFEFSDEAAHEMKVVGDLIRHIEKIRGVKNHQNAA